MQFFNVYNVLQFCLCGLSIILIQAQIIKSSEILESQLHHRAGNIKKNMKLKLNIGFVDLVVLLSKKKKQKQLTKFKAKRKSDATISEENNRKLDR